MQKCLKRFLDHCKFEISFADKLSCMLQVAQGMRYLHSKYLGNSDLKAENVIVFNQPYIHEDCKNAVYKLIDINSNDSTVTHMSPEALQGHYNYVYSDIWNFHVLVWEIFTGRRPFEEFKRNIGSLIIGICDGSARLDFSQNIDTRIHNLMESCSNVEMNKRPSFDTIVKKLSEIELKSESDYCNNKISNIGDQKSREQESTNQESGQDDKVLCFQVPDISLFH